MFDIHFFSRAEKEHERLDERYKRRIIELFEIMRVNPVPAKDFDIVKMKGFENSFRARLGKIRVVYTVYWNEGRIVVSHIGFRESAYD